MAWRSLSGEIDRCIRSMHGMPDIQDFRSTAGYIAATTYGIPMVESMPALVNIAALSWLMRERRVIHRISSGVIRTVDETDLRTLPTIGPRLFDVPWVLTSRSPERGEFLFGNTVELGGYSLEGRMFLVGLSYPDGIRVAGWRPRWGTAELEIKPGGSADLIDDVDAWQDWAKQAARFILILGILMDAEGTPILIAGNNKGRNQKASSHKSSSRSLWNINRVYIDAQVYKGSSGQLRSDGSSDIPSHLRSVQSIVSGHLKRQPYGPGGKLRKWVYVRSYEARRWVAPDRGTIIDVRKLDE